MRTLGRLFIAVALSALSLAAPAAAQAARTVTILHFNDVYEINAVAAGKQGGLARVATVRARLKARHPGLLTTLGGDYLSPSALGTAVVDGKRLDGRQMVAMLNVLGLDWTTFGNHEFDVSQDAFKARMSESKFHVVSSNVTDADGQPFAGTVPYAVVPVRADGGTVRVGLLGLTLDSNHAKWVRYAPPIDAAQHAVDALKGKCDVIVALTHLALDEDRALAEQVPAIDVILGGHEHENWFVERGPHFTPIVKADANVRSVAVVTIRIPRRGARPVVTEQLERIDDTIPEAPRVAAEARKWTTAGMAAFRRLGFEPTRVVATTNEPLDGREAAVRNGHTALTDLILDAYRHEAGTDIAVYNSGSIRIDDVLPAGPISEYDVIRVLPFGGKILKVRMTGALMAHIHDIGQSNKGGGGYLQWAGYPEHVDPEANYTVAVADYLLTGQEMNLGFLTKGNPGVLDGTTLGDVRMAVIDALRRRYQH